LENFDTEESLTIEIFGPEMYTKIPHVSICRNLNRPGFSGEFLV